MDGWFSQLHPLHKLPLTKPVRTLVMERLDARAVALRDRLQALRYHQPLGLESAPLCEALLSDLEQSNQLLKASREEVETHMHALLDAQKSVHPLRQENGRLLRETNKLHLALIEEREGSEVKQRESSAAISKLQGRLSEAMFVSSQLGQRVRTFETDNQALRERIDEALQHNGVVLPSGVEVGHLAPAALPMLPLPASAACRAPLPAGRPQTEWAPPAYCCRCAGMGARSAWSLWSRSLPSLRQRQRPRRRVALRRPRVPRRERRSWCRRRRRR